MADVMRSPGPDEDPAEEHPNEEAGAERGDQPRSGEHDSSKREKKGKKGSFWWELFVLVGTALLLTVLLQMFVARVFVIPSESMMNTLQGCPGCTKDRILVDKITYRFSEPQPGDVVVFSGPTTWMEGQSGDAAAPSNPVAGFFLRAGSMLHLVDSGEKDFVKRVIATGGQTVECCDERNRVLVDGEPLEEPYIHWSGPSKKQEEFGPVRVPQDHLWVMGDNRNNSLDSRYQGGGGRAGAVPVDDVIGKAQFIVLPPTRWQGIDEENPQAMALGAESVREEGDRLPGELGYLTVIPAFWAYRRTVSPVVRTDSREHH
ncbi:signal peptidase I [Actinopolyspora sp. BKK1]|uniref:signal peptidase I n=1 Tax=Actinopolyspora TaxID=1849 RepID=UPI00325C107C